MGVGGGDYGGEIGHERCDERAKGDIKESENKVRDGKISHQRAREPEKG